MDANGGSTWITSAIGRCFDVEFAEDSRRVVEAVFAGKARLLFTEVVEADRSTYSTTTGC